MACGLFSFFWSDRNKPQPYTVYRIINSVKYMYICFIGFKKITNVRMRTVIQTVLNHINDIVIEKIGERQRVRESGNYIIIIKL